MESTCRTRTVQSLVKSMNNNKISLTHKLQRPEDQWSKHAKSLLIDSLLRKMPVNPTYAIKDEDGLSIIDGVQRLSTIRDYVNDKFSLSKDLDDINIDGQDINISGLKFSKLDENVKQTLLDAELQIYELSNCSEWEVRELFKRQNAGKPLNSRQLRVVLSSDKFNEEVSNLVNHPLMEKITSKTQRKNGTARDVIVQTIMLISTNQDNDYTSFRTKDIDKFVIENAEKFNNFDILEEAMTRLDNAIENIKIASTSIPMMLYAAYKIHKDKKSFEKLIDEIVKFCDEYDNNIEYKKFLEQGTTNSVNVRGRFDYWRNIVRTLQ